MPDYSLLIEALGEDFDPEGSSGRFNPHLAVAIPSGEPDPTAHESRERALVGQVGDWVLDEDPTLGRPRTVDGSIGRGAAGWAPVVEWTADAIGQGFIDLVLAAAAAKIVHMLRRGGRGEDAADERSSERVFFISRGMAAAVAANDVAVTFGDRGRLEVEAVEEPSSISGAAAIETSYVGVEPWIVLLRNVESERRYYIVVGPNGEIMGRIETPLLAFETMFLQPLGNEATEEP